MNISELQLIGYKYTDDGFITIVKGRRGWFIQRGQSAFLGKDLEWTWRTNSERDEAFYTNITFESAQDCLDFLENNYKRGDR